MRKLGRKTIFVLLLLFVALALDFSCKTFGANAEPVQQTINYVSLGDSIAAGYGLADYDLANESNSNAFVNGSYAKGFYDYLKTLYSTVNASTYAESGLDSAGLIGKLNSEDENNAEIILALESADIITVCIGANDILQPAKDEMFNQIEASFGGTADEIIIDYNAVESVMNDGLVAFTSNISSILNTLTQLNSNARIFFLDVYNPYFNLMDDNIAHASAMHASFSFLGQNIDINKFFSKQTVKQLGISANTYISGGTNLAGNTVDGLNKILFDEVYKKDAQEHRLYSKAYVIGANSLNYADLIGVKQTFENYDGDYDDLINATLLDYDLEHPLEVNIMSYSNELASLIDPHPTAIGHQQICDVVCDYVAEVLEDEREYTVTFITGIGDQAIPVVYAKNSKLIAQTPFREHYKLTGWQYIDDNNQNKLWDFENDVITKDITLTAVWERLYEVSFDVDGGTEIESIEVSKYSKIIKPEDVVKQGYYFVRWEYEISDGIMEEWNFEEDEVTDDLTLHAVWVKVYIVSFDTDGGTALEYQIVKEGDKITIQNETEKQGSVFVGWATIDDGGQVEYWDFDSNTVNEDTTLKAIWSTIMCDEQYEPQVLTIDTEVNGFAPIRFYLTVETNSMQWFVNSQAQENGNTGTFDFEPPAQVGNYEVYCVVNGKSTGRLTVQVVHGEIDEIKINKENIYSNGLIQIAVEHPELYDNDCVIWWMVQTDEDGTERIVKIGQGVSIEHVFTKSCEVAAEYNKNGKKVSSERLKIEVDPEFDVSMPIFVGLLALIFVGIAFLALTSRRRYDKY
ncbi:MAG: InlB B-repeat-containing protein [Clostridia bacterium]|nr:InlB B-repeat-containing protein [Clostridia bacterium]